MGAGAQGAGTGAPEGPLTGIARLDAMSAVLARNWWLVALRGACAVLFAVLTFVAPAATILTLVIVFAAYMLVDGALGIAAAIRAATRHERWGWMLLEGIVDVVVGVVAFALPGGAVLAFIWILAAWALVTGGLMIAAAFRLHVHYGRWWLGLGGAVSILFGLALLVNPGVSAVVLTYWLGAYALVFGVLLLVLAFRLRARRAAA